MHITKRAVETLQMRDWQVRRECQEARDFERSGDYEAARSALSGLWTTVGERPEIETLPADTQAEVLLRVGTLSGWLGSARQISGAQEFAQDLINESIRRFESLGDQEKIAEAQTDLAICYWRRGAFDEGRVFFRFALTNAVTPENKLRVLVSSSTVEISSGRLDQALCILDEAAPLLEKVADQGAIGRYHVQRALVYKKFGGPENLDRALIEYSAASMNLAEARDSRSLAAVENNIGNVLIRLGSHPEAITHLDKARAIFGTLKDAGNVAQVNETRAHALLGQHCYAEAERAAFAAVTTLERGDELSLLANALITYGLALARSGNQRGARSAFRRAAEAGDLAGDPQTSASAYLVMIEELRSVLIDAELKECFVQADKRLETNLDIETVNRLRACMRIVADSSRQTANGSDLTGGTLEEELLHLEARLIKRALDQANGKVTRAARLLGITHQGLVWSLENKHRDLLRERTPPRRRRKSIMKPVKQEILARR